MKSNRTQLGTPLGADRLLAALRSVLARGREIPVGRRAPIRFLVERFASHRSYPLMAFNDRAYPRESTLNPQGAPDRPGSAHPAALT